MDEKKTWMEQLIHLDLFSGIGGFALATRWVGGFETIAFCEIDKYARGVLKKNFKGIPIFEDVTKLHPTELIPRDGIIHLISAGFPCQDLSVAGKGRGIEADRSGLFFEITRLSDEIYAYCGVRPCLCLENVPNLLAGDGGAWARRVHGELAGRGYSIEWKIVSAADVGAPHLRRRWWCVAYVADTEGIGWNEGWNKNEDSSEDELPGRWRFPDTAYSGGPGRIGNNWAVEPNVGRVAHGVPSRMDRLKGLGNAVVPQVAMIPLKRAKEILTGEMYCERKTGN